MRCDRRVPYNIIILNSFIVHYIQQEYRNIIRGREKNR